MIVPGIGAFIVSEKSASLDESAGKFYPACREISFNRAVNTDDGLLSHSYARKCKALFEEGRSFMNRDIEMLKSRLHNEGCVTIANVGTLHCDGEGKLSFRPLANCDTRKRIFPVLNVDSNIDSLLAIPVVSDSPEMIRVPKDNKIMSGRQISDKYYYVAINKTLAKVVACILVFILFAIGVYFPSGSGGRLEDRASVVPVESVLPVVRKTINIASPSEKKMVAPSYYLIVATFKSVDEAERYVKQHRENGVDLNLVNSGNMSRVYAASSSDKNELVRILNSGDFKKRYAGGWIWRENN